MGLCGQLDTDWVARADDAAGENNAHDPGFANEPVVGTALEHSRHETQTELVELRARIAKARQAKNRGPSNMQFGIDRQREEFQALGCDVLAEFARTHTVLDRLHGS